MAEHPLAHQDESLKMLVIELGSALQTARDTIHSLHGKFGWEIYNEHAPEMKKINSALVKAVEALRVLPKEI